MSSSATILIVDDVEQNRMLLEDMIDALGYQSLLACNGEEALEMVQEHDPDLILLDIIMPKLDGYQVLAWLKSHLAYKQTPVIMISALDDMTGIVKCIEGGANDYLIKPFRSALLRARIKSQIQHKQFERDREQHKRNIEDYNQRLENAVNLKTKELSDAHEKLRGLDSAKSDFLKLIAHELRTPMAGVSGAISLMSMEDTNAEKEGRKELYALAEKSIGRVNDLVEGAINLSRLQVAGDDMVSSDELELPLNQSVGNAIDRISAFALEREVSLVPPSDFEGKVVAAPKYLMMALSGLMKTAIKFANKQSSVYITCSEQQNQIQISISTTGYTITEDYTDKFFDIMAVGDSIFPGGDFGLDAPIAKQVITLMGGEVAAYNEGDGIQIDIRVNRSDVTK